jgi:uncharacterized RDD family membrane protein YckC
MRYAGFWLRVVANIVDSALLTVFGAALVVGAASAGDPEMVLVANLVYLVVALLYWPVMESSARQATVGKMLLGLRVTDMDGAKLPFLRSLLRNLAKIISSIPFGIGFLLAAFSSRKQALHDLITKCLVLREGSSSFVKALGVAVVGIALLVGGSYLAMEQMVGSAMGDFEAAMRGAKPMPPKPPVPAKAPAPKPRAPAPVAKPAVPAPAPAAKPAATQVAAANPAPAAPAAKPAPTPVPAAAPAPNPQPKPEPKPAPAPAPKQAARQEPKPVPPPRPALSAPAMAPLSGPPPVTPKFNDVMTAVLYRDREAVTQLLDLGRWPDKRDSNGLTPLMVAVIVGRDAGMVQLLLERGADPSLQAPGGAIALDLAREVGAGEIETLLLKARAR